MEVCVLTAVVHGWPWWWEVGVVVGQVSGRRCALVVFATLLLLCICVCVLLCCPVLPSVALCHLLVTRGSGKGSNGELGPAKGPTSRLILTRQNSVSRHVLWEARGLGNRRNGGVSKDELGGAANCCRVQV